MERFEIQPVLSSALTDVANFLCTWRGRDDDQHHVRDDAPRIERHLKWLLVENPAITGASQPGFCIRDHLGIIRGLTLAFPAAFLAADRRLLGLCSGSFFVEPQARTQGYYLFRKYLSSPGYSFFFATTCNAESAPLWRRLGGCAVPNSEIEHILPLKLDVMLPAFVCGTTASAVALGMARVLGHCANPILQLLARQSSAVTIEPCQDWQKLSDVSRHHRPTDWITTDRSPEFLQWRYGPSSPHYPTDIYLFRDKLGNEGWFALANVIRGRHGQIRGSVLLDAIWPRKRMSFGDIFPEILRMVPARADALFFRPRPGLDFSECSRWIIPRRWEAPRVFVITRKRDALLPVASLDYGDTAMPFGTWMTRWSDPIVCPSSIQRDVKPVPNSEPVAFL